MYLIWLTDIHLNFLSKKKRLKFYNSFPECDGVLISGDIAESHNVCSMLSEMESTIAKPIYFVLGNHDYYHSSIAKVRKEIASLCQENENLNPMSLPFSRMRTISDKLVIVGVDGFADARIGDFLNTPVELNDHYLIEEFNNARKVGKITLFAEMRNYAGKEANDLKRIIKITVDSERHKKLDTIIVLTHVPPFKEASLYRGKISSDDFLPFYTCKAVGDVLLDAAKTYPQINFVVLCGHTHGSACYAPLQNLTVHVGEAEYNNPIVQPIAIEY